MCTRTPSRFEATDKVCLVPQDPEDAGPEHGWRQQSTYRGHGGPQRKTGPGPLYLDEGQNTNTHSYMDKKQNIILC